MKSMIVAAAAALAFAPVAQAQAGCELASKLNGEALKAFAGIKGEAFDDDFFDTSLWLTGADECGIITTKQPYYYCAWDAESKVSALAAQASLVSSVGPCLKDWAWREMPADFVTTNGPGVMSGFVYEGSGANAGVTWTIYVLEIGETAKEYVRFLEVTGKK